VRWKGPYLEEMMDPWSRKLEYRFPGRHNVRGYDLWSFGPDGENGTPDDINNWQNDQ
jgi:general secretion pathway protein G